MDRPQDNPLLASGQASLLPQPPSNPLIGGISAPSPLFVSPLPAALSIAQPGVGSGLTAASLVPNFLERTITPTLPASFSPASAVPVVPSLLSATSKPSASSFSATSLDSLTLASTSLEGSSKSGSPTFDLDAEPDSFIGQTTDQSEFINPAVNFTDFSNNQPHFQQTYPVQPVSGVNFSAAAAENFMPGSAYMPKQSVAQVNPYRISGKVTHTPVAFDVNTARMAPSFDSTARVQPVNLTPQTATVVAGEQYTYEPVKHHWMYRVVRDNSVCWLPFSRHDSTLIELSALEQPGENYMVNVEGGRYTVDVSRRLKMSVYWEEPVTEVRRCSWFFRSHGDGHFQPYDEHVAQALEEHYATTLISGDFHKRIEFPAGGGAIVIHSPSVVLHFVTSHGSSVEELDAWGNTDNDSRPRALRRGLEDFERDVPDDEAISPPDHLILVVQGVGATARWEGKFRGVVDLVGDMRNVSRQMLREHFSDHLTSGAITRVEFLPICYRNAISPAIMESDDAVAMVTPSGISKLRAFTNESLSDALFYNNSSHSQVIINAVTQEINRIYGLFAERNQGFRGGVSLVGHGSGAVALFDILFNQATGANVNNLVTGVNNLHNVRSAESSGKVLGVESLTDLLSRLGLSGYEEIFSREQIDLDSLHLLKPDDIKELGLPMGPRKKLLDFLQNSASVSSAKDINTSSNNNVAQNSQILNVGIQMPPVTYPRLIFAPWAVFALGSPVALHISLRKMLLNSDFTLPTCSRFFNIFHPYDPLACRMEPLLLSQDQTPAKPFLIPHHKGRKRMHLELRESLVRVGSDLKQKLLESWRKTWKAVTGFAASHMTGSESQELDEPELGEVDSVLGDLVGEGGASGSGGEEVGSIGARINMGRRVDYVLQEKPIEMFNDYLFAVGSRSCYWLSEDTALMLLREIYESGRDSENSAASPGKYGARIESGHHVAPPPLSGFVTSTQQLYTTVQHQTGNPAITGSFKPVQTGFVQPIPVQSSLSQPSLVPQTSLMQPAGFMQSQPVQTGLIQPVQSPLNSKPVTGSSRFGPPLASVGSINQGGVKPVIGNLGGAAGAGGSRSGTPVLGLAAPSLLPPNLVRK